MVKKNILLLLVLVIVLEGCAKNIPNAEEMTTDKSVVAEDETDTKENVIITSTFIEEAIFRNISKQERLLLESMGVWELQDYYLPRGGFSSDVSAESYVTKAVDIYCKNGMPYILFMGQEYEFQYCRPLSERDLIDSYNLPSSVISDEYMGKNSIYEMLFQAENGKFYLILNEDGEAYCSIGREVADGAVFVMQNTEKCDVENEIIIEYFDEKEQLILEKCGLQSDYQDIQIEKSGVMTSYYTLDMPNIENEIHVLQSNEDIYIEIEEYCLSLEEIKEVSGIFFPWGTIMSFVPPEEYALTYKFKGENCEVDITVTSRGEQYIKVLGSVDGEGNVYKIGKAEH